MKYLKPYKVSDSDELSKLGSNKLLSSYPFIKNNKKIIEDYYVEYHKNSGYPKPQKIIKPGSKEDGAFKSHYNQPPKGCLDFIEIVRKKLSRRVCPMCGSLGNFEVDHFLPRGKNPEFSFYSKNLIPACSCNNKKNDLNPNYDDKEKFLHPYYDEILKERLYYPIFDGDLNNPKMSLKLCDVEKKKQSIQFHIDNVIIPNGIFDYFDDMYSCLIQNPVDFLMLEDIQPLTLLEVVEAIKNLQIGFERRLKTPNNWDSLFYFGVLKNKDVLEFIYNEIE